MVPIEDNELLAGLSEAQRRSLAAGLVIQDVPAGADVVREGEPADSLGLLCAGRLLIWRESQGHRVDLAVLEAGEWFGSSSFTSRIRSASITAQTDARLAILPLDGAFRALGGAPTPAPDPVECFLLNVTLAQQQQLQRANDLALRDARRRARAGNAVAILISLVSVYAYFLRAFPGAEGRALELTSLAVALLASACAVLFATQSGLPPRAFGLVRAGTVRAVGAAILWAVAICLVLTGLKGALLGTEELIAAVPAGVGLASLAGWGMLYLVSSLIQEFAARSFLQTVFEQLFSGSLRDLRAVLLSNLVFSVFHLHYSTQFALMTFLCGLLFGVFWVRHRNLLAITVLHWLVGMWAMDALGLFSIPGMIGGQI